MALPTEIWLHIFRTATVTRDSPQPLETHYLPFRTISCLNPHLNLTEENQAWTTKASLTLVCKYWRELSLQYMYETVYLGEHLILLLGGLKRSEKAAVGKGYGHNVRRIVLSSWKIEWPNPKPLTDIIHHCPNATILVKRDDDTSPLFLPNLSLSQFRRFDWQYARGFNVDPQLSYLDHGLDFVRNTVAAAHNLRYLLIDIRCAASRSSKYPPTTITLPNLSILHVRGLTSNLRREIEGWSFPKLTHIITDCSLMWYTPSTLFNSQTEVIEFLRDEMLVELVPLGIVERCPNLRELNYSMEFMRFPVSQILHIGLKCIGLHAGSNLDQPAADLRKRYQRHFDDIMETSLPALQVIILYGDWALITESSWFLLAVQKGIVSGCRLEYPDGSPVIDS